MKKFKIFIILFIVMVMPISFVNAESKYNYIENNNISFAEKSNINILADTAIQYGKKTTTKCSDLKYLTQTWNLIKLLAPFLLIVFGSFDFLKAIMAGDEKKIKEAKGKFTKRLIAFILLIFVPFLISFIFSKFGDSGSGNLCLFKCVVTNDQSGKVCK